MSPTNKPDINSRDDLVCLLEHFYTSVLSDPIIGFYFTDVMHFSLEEHLPKVTAFWAKQLFGSLDYRGRTFELHLALHRHTAITAHHFHRWLYLFSGSIDQLYAGPNAEMLKHRAQAIAASMTEALDKHPVGTGEPQGIFIPANDHNQE